MARAPAKENVHGYQIIKQTFDQATTSLKRFRKLEQQKQGNESVYFLIDGWFMFSTRLSVAYFDKRPLVFIDGEKIKLAHVNNKLKRSQIKIAFKESEDSEKKFGKQVVAFRSGTEE
ncbi:MAG: hypothetical protein A2546_06170 [Sphingobacteriia bacterium RIFOXYD2_FULL_35_12]|nr:MAG: hypothetical protein A2472_14075 [Sphingobacteriia bacterium RIFOXYC2_FULL_35_18]OHC88900.1 MAG: hypothetical protein A2546_06170 [Sphingobacteriia bacterium RIFOXYD2_FULL_35_12]